MSHTLTFTTCINTATSKEKHVRTSDVTLCSLHVQCTCAVYMCSLSAQSFEFLFQVGGALMCKAFWDRLPPSCSSCLLIKRTSLASCLEVLKVKAVQNFLHLSSSAQHQKLLVFFVCLFVFTPAPSDSLEEEADHHQRMYQSHCHQERLNKSATV